MSEKGIPEDNRHVRRDFVNRFHNMLHHMRRRGQTEKIGTAKGCDGRSRQQSGIC